MANIMLTYRCNLNCPYCFANEFVNKTKTDITIENLMKAINFITRKGNSVIGLIGGEPTLHPGFPVVMEILTDTPKVIGVNLFTNGLLMDQYIPQIIHPKVRFILVNCNSPQMIGENAFARIQKNLDLLTQQIDNRNRVVLGINLYSDDMDYSYIIELLQRYNMHRVRISLTVPDFSTCGEVDVLDYFNKRKGFLLEFFRRMDDIQVVPHYDCNVPPYCIWTEEEKEWLKAYVSKYPDIKSNLTGYHSRCKPVIDILPNLQAVRCFGMSDFSKVSLEDFKTDYDIYNYFKNEIDSIGYKLPGCEKCQGCYEQQTRQCVTGCLGFKSNRIRSCNQIIGNL